MGKRPVETRNFEELHYQMREMFRGYYKPTEVEIAEMWINGDLIFDTNALLNLFRYTEETRNEFLDVLSERRESLWIPHQIGMEFHRNRLAVVFDQVEPYGKLDAVLKVAREKVQEVLDEYEKKDHPSFDHGAMSTMWSEGLESLSQEMGAARKRHSRYGSLVDEIVEKVTAIFEGRVGERYKEDQLTSLYKTAIERYAKKVPPGYKDSDKPEPERYGDFVLWMQILDRAGETKRPAIFVTDDGKEDWWYRVRGQTQGPRVELVEEYHERSGRRIHFYSPERFLEFAKPSVSAEALNEVERVSTARAVRSKSSDRGRVARRLRERIDVEAGLSDSLAALSAVTERARDAEQRISELEVQLIEIEDLIRHHEQGRRPRDDVRLKFIKSERDSLAKRIAANRKIVGEFYLAEERAASMRDRLARIEVDVADALSDLGEESSSGESDGQGNFE